MNFTQLIEYQIFTNHFANFAYRFYQAIEFYMFTFFSKQTRPTELRPAQVSFTAIGFPYFPAYLFFRVSLVERLWYSLLFWLYKISEHDADNVLELNILGVLRFRLKGMKDFIMLLLFCVLLYAYLR